MSPFYWTLLGSCPCAGLAHAPSELRNQLLLPLDHDCVLLVRLVVMPAAKQHKSGQRLILSQKYMDALYS